MKFDKFPIKKQIIRIDKLLLIPIKDNKIIEINVPGTYNNDSFFLPKTPIYINSKISSNFVITAYINKIVQGIIRLSIEKVEVNLFSMNLLFMANIIINKFREETKVPIFMIPISFLRDCFLKLLFNFAFISLVISIRLLYLRRKKNLVGKTDTFAIFWIIANLPKSSYKPKKPIKNLA